MGKCKKIREFIKNIYTFCQKYVYFLTRAEKLAMLKKYGR